MFPSDLSEQFMHRLATGERQGASELIVNLGFVVEAQRVIDGRDQIFRPGWAFLGVGSDLVRSTDHSSARDTSARNHRRVASGPVIPSRRVGSRIH